MAHISEMPLVIIVDWEGRSYDFSVDREEVLRPNLTDGFHFHSGWDVEGVFATAPVASIDTPCRVIECRHGIRRETTGSLREHYGKDADGEAWDSAAYLADVQRALEAPDAWAALPSLDEGLSIMDTWHGDEFFPHPYTG